MPILSNNVYVLYLFQYPFKTKQKKDDVSTVVYNNLLWCSALKTSMRICRYGNANIVLEDL